MLIPKLLAVITGLLFAGPHPHYNKAIKLHGAKGVVTITYFTVPFNAKQLEGRESGFSWHLGLAGLETEIPLRCDGEVVPAGKYKLNVQRGDGPDDWSVILEPWELAVAKMRSRRGGGDREAVAALEAKLEKDGMPKQIGLDLASFKADHEEHLDIAAIHRGYATAGRGSDEPTGGARFSVRIGFGDLHKELAFDEVYEKSDK